MTGAAPELLRAEAISKTWHSTGPALVRAVIEASLSVRPGETVVVTGPSGSGKTTLLSMLGGLLRPDAGHVWLDGLDLAVAGENVRQRVRLQTVGFVFQRGLLLEHLTARQNVAIVPQAAGLSRRAAAARADELLERLGLAARATLYPPALSPGECQRVALARALAIHPRLVLADEPTAHLDGTTGAEVVRALRRLAADDGTALVIVTHDERLTGAADRLLRLEDGRLAAAVERG